LVGAFNRNYSLFAGGVFEAMEASIKSADHLVPGLADVAAICKPGVFPCPGKSPEKSGDFPSDSHTRRVYSRECNSARP
jgi:hypothetical protein